MSKAPQFFFSPVEGALLDLQSLQAISSASEALLGAQLQVTWPGASSLVLNGLEVDGDWSKSGPPGARIYDTNSRGITVSPGSAILTAQNNRRYLLTVHEPMQVEWPNAKGAGIRAMLVLLPQVEPANLDGSVLVAREQVQAKLGFVRPEDAGQSFLLPLASSVGSGIWATDLQRYWQPEDPAILWLLKRIERLEHTVWKAEPDGSVWERQILGRNWVRYQTVAASALQAARLCLLSRAMTTRDRVRLMNGLYEQLLSSVERAAQDLIRDIVGPRESAGPYGIIGSQTMRG